MSAFGVITSGLIGSTVKMALFLKDVPNASDLAGLTVNMLPSTVILTR